MAEISASSWNETDNSNTSSPPAGAPENMAAGAVNDVIRMIMGAVKRSWARINFVLTTAGSDNAYTLSPSAAVAALVDGERFAAKADRDNTGAVTLQISELAAKAVKKLGSSGYVDLAAGDLVADQRFEVVYDATLGYFVLVSPLAFEAGRLFGTTLSYDNAELAAKGYVDVVASRVDSGSSLTIGAFTAGNVKLIRLTANATLTLPDAPDTSDTQVSLEVHLIQDGTGSRAVTWAAPSGYTIAWDQTASAPSIATAAGKETHFVFRYLAGGSTIYGNRVWKAAS